MDANFVSSRAKQIEGLLRRLGAEGRGLRELMESARLDAETERHCRRVAAIRNKVIHDSEFVPDSNEERRFTESVDYVVRQLEERIRARTTAEGDAPAPKKSKLALILTAIGLAAATIAILLIPNR